MSKEQQETIDESELVENLDPSDGFVALVGRVGSQVGIGSLSLGAIQTAVRDRADSADASTAETTLGASSPNA